MRILTTLMLTILTAGLVHADELAIGATIPMADHKMTNVDDKQIALADVKGEQGTVVTFWCNTCPWVHRWRARFNELASEYQGKGFGFIAINPNDPAKSKGDSKEGMQKEVAAHSYSYPYVIDEGSKVAKAFHATHTPHIFVFDKDDKLVFVGAIDDNAGDVNKVKEHYLKAAMDAMIAKEPIKTERVKSLGCTIKWYN